MPEQSIGDRIRMMWDRLSKVPGGKRVFSYAIGRAAPYTGTIGAIVDELEPGYAKVLLHDRKKVRNHLNCIHAIALINLGEVSTGLAVIAGMPTGCRGILSGISMEYHQKARGTLTAECRCEPFDTTERREMLITGHIRNAQGELVATATATWLVGPEKAASKAA